MNNPVPRREFQHGTLRRESLDPDPIKQFAIWFDDAIKSQSIDPDAMTFATADRTGRPSARTVLLKHFDENGFVFATNYMSRKGRELAENPHAAILFYWPLLERQIHIAGEISKTSEDESDKYFNERPELSRLAAITSRKARSSRIEMFSTKNSKIFPENFKVKKSLRPKHWGGYLLRPETIEFWQGGANRLHDRFQYRKQNGGWIIERLSP